MTDDFRLSEAQVDAFNGRGYLIADFSLAPELLDAIVRKVAPLYEPDELARRHHGTRIQDAWREVEEVRRLAVNGKVLSALEQLFGRTPRPFQTLNFPIGTMQPAHSDTIHFNSAPNNYMTGVWVALEDVDEDNGPLLYYPGSHKGKEYTMQSFRLGPGHANYARYEEKIGEIIAARQLRPEYAVMKKGEALIWHANLLHGGAPQNDPARSRHSQVTHYFFEGCRYYRPMDSRPWRRRYLAPAWIPTS